MSKVIEPTVGRRVWYYPSDFDRGLLEQQPESRIQAAKDRLRAKGVPLT
jgi:hypothetical protein